MKTERRRKAVAVFVLVLLIIIAVLINNHWGGDWSPNGSDEHAYIGAAMRLVVFETKELHAPPDSPLLFSYAMGIAHVFTGLSVTALFHITHMLILTLIILSFYRLGKVYSTKAGLLLAALITFYYAPSFYLGLWTMVPSLFMFLILPNLFLTLLNKQYFLSSVWFFLLGALYWWGIVPFVISILVFFILKRIRQWWYSIPVLLAAGYLISLLPFFQDFVFYFFPPNAFPEWYLGRFFEIFILFFPAVFGFLIMLRSKDERIQQLKIVALTLITTNVLFWLTISTYAHVRTVFFLWIGLFLLIAVFFAEGHKVLPRYAVAGIFLLFFAPFAGIVAQSNAFEALGNHSRGVTTFPEEQEVFQWLNEDEATPLVLSDYPSMLTTTYYTPAANAVYFTNGDVSSEFFIRTDNGYTLDMSKIYDLLWRKAFTAEDFDLLRSLKEESGAESIYILISPRTRQEISIYNKYKRIEGKLLVNNDYRAIPEFAGEEKFKKSPLTELLYDQGGIQVYQILGV